jgi:hypothetical protein
MIVKANRPKHVDWIVCFIAIPIAIVGDVARLTAVAGEYVDELCTYALDKLGI